MLEVDGRTETYDGVGPLVPFADGVTLFTPGGGHAGHVVPADAAWLFSRRSSGR